MGFVTTAATGLSFWHPAANAFVMMFLAVPGNLSFTYYKKFLSVINFFLLQQSCLAFNTRNQEGKMSTSSSSWSSVYGNLGGCCFMLGQ